MEDEKRNALGRRDSPEMVPHKKAIGLLILWHPVDLIAVAELMTPQSALKTMMWDSNSFEIMTPQSFLEFMTPQSFWKL